MRTQTYACVLVNPGGVPLLRPFLAEAFLRLKILIVSDNACNNVLANVAALLTQCSLDNRTPHSMPCDKRDSCRWIDLNWIRLT